MKTMTEEIEDLEDAVLNEELANQTSVEEESRSANSQYSSLVLELAEEILGVIKKQVEEIPPFQRLFRVKDGYISPIQKRERILRIVKMSEEGFYYC